MKDNVFGLNLNVDGIGHVDMRSKTSLHNIKSIAGSTFRSPQIKSVCVYNNKGLAHLYLKKTENGVIREER